MKIARPPLPPAALQQPDALLTTKDVAALLRVHPKHVYRLMRGGLPAHRMGGEWRYVTAEVLQWAGAGGRSSRRGPAPDTLSAPPPSSPEPPALLATNGDLAVEHLLRRLTSAGRPLLGHVQADRASAFEMLRRGEVLAAGCHGNDIPTALEDHRLAFIHLVDRQVGLALRPGVRLRSLRQIGRWRLASRPQTAGVRGHFDEQLRREGIDPGAVHARAAELPSHREVVCAVARGEADVGLASLAWAHHVGLECLPLCQESYGLLVRASLLGDPRIVRLCEMAQSTEFRREVGAVHGYRTRQTGAISYEAPGPAVPVAHAHRTSGRTS
jgi:excisionase family DNA binding protein